MRHWTSDVNRNRGNVVSKHVTEKYRSNFEEFLVLNPQTFTIRVHYVFFPYYKNRKRERRKEMGTSQNLNDRQNLINGNLLYYSV